MRHHYPFWFTGGPGGTGWAPDTGAVLDAAAHNRPHFLDLDQQYLYIEPGNRSIVFTLVTPNPGACFKGPMQRTILQWPKGSLPGLTALSELPDIDGILITGKASELINWQDAIFPIHEQILPVCFSDISLQMRWFSLTEPDKYHLDLFLD